MASETETTRESNPQQLSTGDALQNTDEETQIPSPVTVGKRGKQQTVLLMTGLCMSVFLAALDITIVATALPTISEHFQSTAGYIWVGSAFLLANATSVPCWGKLSDIWGRKPLILTAVAVFFLGSALCGAAINVAMVIAGRAVQGVGAGGLLTLVNVVIGDLFSQRDRGKYYGIIGMVWATAAAIGPVLGGVLTDKVSWRWCFYINLPISGAAFGIILATLTLRTPKTPILEGLKAIDWIGSLTITGATLMILLGLQFGGTIRSWDSAIVICLLVFGVVTALIFIGVEWKVARYPIIPLHLFTSISNIACLFVILIHGLVFIQGLYFLPLYFQSVLGATPLLSGVWLLPMALSLSLMTAVTGIYMKKTGRYLDCIQSGFVISVLGFGLFYNLPDHRSWAKIILYQIVAGLGTGPNFQPPLVALQSNVSAQDNATVTATFGFVRNIACSIGIVIGSVIFSSKMTMQQDTLRAALGGDTASLLAGSIAQSDVFLIDGLPSPAQKIVRHAFFNSLQDVWIEVVCFTAVGLLVSLLIKKKILNKEHEEVKTGLEGEKERWRIAQQLRGDSKVSEAKEISDSA